jgi:squalene synthase HpnC
MGLDQAFGYCEKLAKSHYENFSVTNLWLPADIRPHFTSIYAYCRWSDDLADEIGDSNRSSKLLAWWKDQLQASMRGEARHPVFIALHHTIRLFSMRIEPFEDLLSAFVQDQTVKSYSDDAQLLEYCRRSANPVGRLILALARTSDSKSIEWSDSICTGLQIANFCQDVAVDAQRGRVYLPKSRMDQVGITPNDWNVGNENARKALSDWVDDAHQHLSNGEPLIAHGPTWLRRSVQLFVGGGRQILRNIANNQYDVWRNPPKVTKLQKLNLVLRALSGVGTRGPKR